MRQSWIRRPTLGLFAGALLSTVLGARSAEAADVCYQLTSLFLRAPTTTSVAKCTFEGLDSWEERLFCSAQPFCCLPGCELQPTCIFFEELS